MEYFSTLNEFKKVFLNEKKLVSSRVKVDYVSKENLIKIKGFKTPVPHIIASVGILKDTGLFTGTYMSGNEFLYKFLYKPRSVPVRAAGKFNISHSSEENAIKSSIAVDCVQDPLSFYLKLQDNPLKILASTVFQKDRMSYYGKIKKLIGAKDHISYLAGACLLSENSKVAAEWCSVFDTVSIWSQQKVNEFTSFTQFMAMKHFRKLSTIEVGVSHKASSNTTITAFVTGSGKLAVTVNYALSKVEMSASFVTNLNTYRKNTIEFLAGYKIHISI